MTPFDDELAALLALDALEADEQADAELLMGTFPAGLGEASATLADAVALAPPEDLRSAMLDQACARRIPGRPVNGAALCPPDEAFRRTIADMDRLLASLSDAEWDVLAHPEHGRVRDLIAHLVGIERLSVRWLNGDDVPVLLDHVAATQPVVDTLAAVPAREVARQWRETALAVSAAAAAGDPRRSVTFHDLSISLDAFLTTRMFEVWAHAMDIAAATGRPMLRLDDERMAMMSTRLMDFVPLTLAYRNTTARGRSIRFVLTGASGGCYIVPLHPGDIAGEPEATIIADTVDLCRLAARRLHTDELDAVVEGDRDLADLVLAGLDSLARD